MIKKENEVIHKFITLKKYLNNTTTTKVNLDYVLKSHEITKNNKGALALMKDNPNNYIEVALFSALHDEVGNLIEADVKYYDSIVNYINEVVTKGFDCNINLDVTSLKSITSALSIYGMYNVAMTIYMKKDQIKFNSKSKTVTKMVKLLIKKGEFLNKIIWVN